MFSAGVVIHAARACVTEAGKSFRAAKGCFLPGRQPTPFPLCEFFAGHNRRGNDGKSPRQGATDPADAAKTFRPPENRLGPALGWVRPPPAGVQCIASDLG